MKLEAASRTLLGKKVKTIRRLGRLPATVYGHDVSAESIDIDARQFRLVHSTAGDNQLIDLVIDGKRSRPVLIHGTQIDPRRNTAMHVEFYQANLTEKLRAQIPVHIVGEAPASRDGLLVLSLVDTIEVECLPNDLPASIEVDISDLSEVGAAVHVRDLVLDTQKCEVKSDPDEIVVHVVTPQVVREDQEPAEAGADEGVGAGGMAAETGAREGAGNSES